MKSDTLAVANRAFEQLKHGLATGEWDSFLDLLTDDFTLWFPAGRFHGLNQGKDKAREFFHYASESFREGLEVILDRVTSNETTVVFEVRSQGKLRGEAYKNRIAISLDVRGDKICAYREYFGSDGKSY
ncbi:MAG: nuclear transport factor 2 family protein [Oscillatoria sp. PMC 1051.18]|uniref:nuclear transport factor 2 family protein n=1 Tax=Oscillatoria salina TaxID=331517 RepID=UPI0013BBDAC9|nr:nuclear transport factor 2 family protein [Oscillatoria salina]MBZ8180210.1 nuclear transport factor 2 family protein [Oscillatoria salina IIICB1]MEC4891561.1 nuclear transport factor 2 family protein [Oscillatoria sp. PMC 1050.18]MEC5029655.1 nuclear transport factor 2 family protein [Oscillatoria sp. PMC 1051.18]NET89514.1 nuclear transport factor 2 family protein [Kamptonema sp. SIO1D9]